MSKMYPTRGVDIYVRNKSGRSHSVQGLATNITSPAMKIPLPPRLWLTGQHYATNICCLIQNLLALFI